MYSPLQQFQSLDRPWVIAEGKFFLFYKQGNLPATIRNRTLGGLKDEGPIAKFERDLLARNKQLLRSRGRALSQAPKTIFEELHIAYKRLVREHEENAKRNFSVLVEQYTPTPGFCEMFRDSSPLERTLKKIKPAAGYLGVGDELYLLQKRGGIQFSFGGHNYGLVRVCHLEELIEEHAREIRASLGRANIIHDSEIRASRQSDIYLEEGKKRNTIHVEIEPFVMRTAQGLYKFERCAISFSYLKRDGYLMRIDVPHITPSHYKHPFKFDSGKICFRSDERWKKMGIAVEQKIPASRALKRFAYVAAESARTLRRGYGEHVQPVRTITEFDTTNETKAVREGVVIYDN